jgi:two-component system, NarL family, nitrate/nitrite response regulator NarL
MTKISSVEMQCSTKQLELKQLDSTSTQAGPAQRQSPIRVVIASESWIMAEGIRHALSAPQIEIAAVCLDPTTTLDSISVYAPNVLVASAGANGLANTILPRIRKLNLQTRSVAMLDRIDHSDLLRATSLGAFGVVSIKAAAEDLLACVRAVASGIVWIQSEITHYAPAATNAAPIAGASGLDSLTVQQRKIAKLVAVGMRNKHIANELAITEGTVKVHLHSIFARLGVTSRAELGSTIRSSCPGFWAAGVIRSAYGRDEELENA